LSVDRLAVKGFARPVARSPRERPGSPFQCQVRFSDSRAGSTWLYNRAEAVVFYNVPDSLIFRANT